MSDQLYLGEFDHSVDSQRRVAIPRTWRSTSEKRTRLVILPGRDKTLLAVSPEKAKEMLKKLTAGSFANRNVSKALAMIGSYAVDCTCDKQGRIALSRKLMDYAGINEHVVFVGSFDSIQIWSKELWDQQQFDVDDILDVIQDLQEQPSDVGNALGNLIDGLK
jgi:MraZ protein